MSNGPDGLWYKAKTIRLKSFKQQYSIHKSIKNISLITTLKPINCFKKIAVTSPRFWDIAVKFASW